MILSTIYALLSFIGVNFFYILWFKIRFEFDGLAISDIIHVLIGQITPRCFCSFLTFLRFPTIFTISDSFSRFPLFFTFSGNFHVFRFLPQNFSFFSLYRCFSLLVLFVLLFVSFYYAFLLFLSLLSLFFLFFLLYNCWMKICTPISQYNKCLMNNRFYFKWF